ncbi:YqhV family protein [Halonatronum saccharophilum]|uniref:YqhV family protein n=1 Tax=Halonatronum saccharophilum TaxID=150060 RepID=UPI0004848572|nr:YqhV family protein [Halonatronum saccharophilum]
MFIIRDRIVLGMSMLRVISGSIELLAAFLMFKYNSKEIAFQINSILALVGPTIMILVTTLGLIGLAGKFSLLQMVVIMTGVALIFIGMKL